jgi:predicted MFS family arabinose efflux permease
MLCVALSFLMTRIAPAGSPVALIVLVAAGVMVDFGATANLVLGQRAIFSLGPEYRSRLNGLYMAIFFAGGAAGSAVGGWTYATGGWAMASAIGAALPLVALGYFATERQ